MGTGPTGTQDPFTGARIMHPTAWAEATPDALAAQLDACIAWDARPTTKGTPCEASVPGLGKCDLYAQNENSCYGSVRAFCPCV